MANNKNKKLQRGAMCTDIHFGKKANSHLHNQDCLNYLDWFCEQVKQDPSIDYVAFLGDWNENRSALNVATLNYSYQGAKKLNDLGLPVYFCVGNHDLYHRHTREIYSIVPFQEFKNFKVINDIYVAEEIEGKALFAPYLFHEEYKALTKYTKIPFWAGHFEFKGFMITGYNMIMPTGPDPNDFKGPKHIVSGHFHKRQTAANVTYIGNTFPMDFGDAGDNERGMMIYDHNVDDMIFYNWNECPKYIKTTLTDILDKTTTLEENARVRCIADVPLSFEESTYLRQQFIDKYNLREFTLEESKEINAALKDTQTSIDPDNVELDSVDDLVVQMLDDIESDHIDNNMLVDIYKRISS